MFVCYLCHDRQNAHNSDKNSNGCGGEVNDLERQTRNDYDWYYNVINIHMNEENVSVCSHLSQVEEEAGVLSGLRQVRQEHGDADQ